MPKKDGDCCLMLRRTCRLEDAQSEALRLDRIRGYEVRCLVRLAVVQVLLDGKGQRRSFLDKLHALEGHWSVSCRVASVRSMVALRVLTWGS